MQDEPFSRTIHRVLVLNPVLSISSPGFQKSSPGFVKHESGFFSSPGPGFSRVRIFFESESGSESGPGFEVCPFSVVLRILHRIKARLNPNYYV